MILLYNITMSFLPKRSIYTNIYSRKYIRFQKGNAFRFTQCAQNQTERRAINFLFRQSFRFFISAVRFRAYSTSRKNDRRSKSRTMRVFASEYDFYRGSTNRKGRPIVPRDCGGRLSWIKGISDNLSTLPSILASFHVPFPFDFRMIGVYVWTPEYVVRIVTEIYITSKYIK